MRRTFPSCSADGRRSAVSRLRHRMHSGQVQEGPHAPRISGPSPRSRAAAVHKTTFGGHGSVMRGIIIGTEAAIVRPSARIAAATLLANDGDRWDPGGRRDVL